MNEPGSVVSVRPRVIAVAVTCVLLWGCGDEAVRIPTTSPPRVVETRSTPVDGLAGDASPARLRTVDRAGYDAALAKLRGKVVLVDFWATWCLPCVEQLPHTLALGSRLADRGLAVITVSCDDAAESERVGQFLASQQAGAATNLLSQYGGSPQTMEVFEITTGAVPFYKLYDRQGQLRQTFGIRPTAKKQYTIGEIETAVEALLRE